MASIRKARDKWLAEIRTKGKYISKLHATKVQAHAWAASIEHEMGKNPDILAGKTLADAMRRYADEVSPTKKGSRWEVVRLNKLCRDALADHLLINLTTDDIQQWISRQQATLSDSSIRRELNLLNSVLSVARKRWRWMERNIFQDVERPKADAPRDRRISDKELKRILQALEYEEKKPIRTMRQQIAVAMLLAIETAMRQGEIWALQWENVKLSDRFVTLPDTKNGSKRNVPLSRRAVDLLKKMQPAKQGAVFNCSQASAGTIFRRAVELAEIKDFRFHDLRHEALTRLARKLDVLDLARMVGHRDPRSLMIYYNATASEIAKRLG
jgi:integrase